jgi:predicted transposase/invertase (TIGR01784 family)
MLANENSAIREAVGVLADLSMDEALRDIVIHREMYKQEEEAIREERYKKGIEIGEARGEAKRNIEIAKNSLKEGFTPEQISKITGLSIDKIQVLR